MRVVVVGAGIGGLASALLLAAQGCEVTVVEAAEAAGGKVRRLAAGDTLVDAGPTVFTMKPVFDALFAAAGARLEDHLRVRRAGVIARHAWGAEARLDLHDDAEASEAAIGAFAGAAAARAYRRFRTAAERVYATLDRPFLQNSNTNPIALSQRIGIGRIGDLLALRPYESLWTVLGEYFADPRLRQLFARYSTYCGSSPLRAPSTLMLVAHVEAMGVWLIEGGMGALAAALQRVAETQGARFRFGETVTGIMTRGGRAGGVVLASGERIEADAVIANADPAAIASGQLGPEAARAVSRVAPADRSLSAMVWLVEARTGGFPLRRHNVFFSPDYPAEFAALGAGRMPEDPSVYVCALDREAAEAGEPGGPERLQIILNAPANGDTHPYPEKEIDLCGRRMFARLAAAGLRLEPPSGQTVITPADFEARFPSTGGALYGRASHGWAASFLRQSARTRIPGLYCAGGSTHPGAGVPMAALSARLAVARLMRDRASTARSRAAVTAGGTSTRSATAAATG